MSSSKLSDAQKQEIIQLYQEVPEETTITLAERYGVSSSTVRRVLQSAIPKERYDSLTQQKQRLHRTGKRSQRTSQTPSTSSSPVVLEVDSQTAEESNPSEASLTLKRRRKRSSAIESTQSEKFPDSETVTPAVEKPVLSAGGSRPKPVSKPEIQQLTLEDFLSSREELSEFEDPEEEYLEEDETETDEPDELLIFTDSTLHRPDTDQVRILPLSEAALPRTCYLVIDRAAELITKPLKAFSELGNIPPDEFQKKTLPIFDNHRVASRFSTRNQRVFKVPDTQLFQKVAPYLHAKGITRLLIDGQVYRL